MVAKRFPAPRAFGIIAPVFSQPNVRASGAMEPKP
jgi:hypothetical protein